MCKLVAERGLELLFLHAADLLNGKVSGCLSSLACMLFILAYLEVVDGDVVGKWVILIDKFWVEHNITVNLLSLLANI